MLQNGVDWLMLFLKWRVPIRRENFVIDTINMITDNNVIVSYNYGLLLTRVGESKARLIQEQSAMILVRAGSCIAQIIKRREQGS